MVGACSTHEKENKLYSVILKGRYQLQNILGVGHKIILKKILKKCGVKMSTRSFRGHLHVT
jgi:hypothetical protein